MDESIMCGAPGASQEWLSRCGHWADEFIGALCLRLSPPLKPLGVGQQLAIATYGPVESQPGASGLKTCRASPTSTSACPINSSKPCFTPCLRPRTCYYEACLLSGSFSRNVTRQRGHEGPQAGHGRQLRICAIGHCRTWRGNHRCRRVELLLCQLLAEDVVSLKIG